MKTSIVGFGCVESGTVTCIAAEGRDVMSVDYNPTEVDLINAGQSTMVDRDVGELVRNSVAGTITEDAPGPICVGPPRQFGKI